MCDSVGLYLSYYNSIYYFIFFSSHSLGCRFFILNIEWKFIPRYRDKKTNNPSPLYVSYRTSIHIKRQSEHSIPRIIIIYSTINGCQSTESKIANILNVFNSCKKKKWSRNGLQWNFVRWNTEWMIEEYNNGEVAWHFCECFLKCVNWVFGRLKRKLLTCVIHIENITNDFAF